MLAQFLEREARGMLALAAVCAVIIRVVDVGEGCGLQFRVFHLPTLACAGCGLLMHKSYSVDTERELDKADAARRWQWTSERQTGGLMPLICLRERGRDRAALFFVSVGGENGGLPQFSLLHSRIERRTPK